jgi:ethanolamine utilization protein EutA (predicted chaperonin)
MSETLTMLGMDIGTTTSHCVVARARLTTHPILRSRKTFSDLKFIYQSPVTMTPLSDGILDIGVLEERLMGWLRDAGKVDVASVLVTGLASRASNHEKLRALLSTLMPAAFVRVRSVMVAPATWPSMNRELALWR